jgi:hypothetical protein
VAVTWLPLPEPKDGAAEINVFDPTTVTIGRVPGVTPFGKDCVCYYSGATGFFKLLDCL